MFYYVCLFAKMFPETILMLSDLPTENIISIRAVLLQYSDR